MRKPKAATVDVVMPNGKSISFPKADVEVKEKLHKLDIAPFNYEVNIVLTENIADSRIKRNRTLGSVSKDDLTGTVALHCAVHDKPISYIFLPFESDIGYVAHECFHCVWRIMKFIGAEHENEVMAYTLGYLVRQATRFILRESEGVMQA